VAHFVILESAERVILATFASAREDKVKTRIRTSFTNFQTHVFCPTRRPSA